MLKSAPSIANLSMSHDNATTRIDKAVTLAPPRRRTDVLTAPSRSTSGFRRSQNVPNCQTDVILCTGLTTVPDDVTAELKGRRILSGFAEYR